MARILAVLPCASDEATTWERARKGSGGLGRAGEADGQDEPRRSEAEARGVEV